MLVSVIIVNYNRCNDLREAIRSVKKQDHPEVEIIVVDNNSRDNSITMLRKEFPEVSFIDLKENIGMDGYSIGFKESRGEIVFQMDNDSLMPDGDVLSNVVRRFKEGPEDLAAVAARVEEYNPAGDDVMTARSRDTRTGPITTGGFHSGGVGFQKQYLDNVGYYNRDVFLYGSELFLQMKFLAAGYRIFFYPEILMLHKSSATARSTKGLYYEIRNRYWFMRKFATLSQKMRYFPTMFLHDSVYAFYKKAPHTFMRAIRDGFGIMPASLATSQRSTRPAFVDKVTEVAEGFDLAHLLSRIAGAMRRRKAGKRE